MRGYRASTLVVVGFCLTGILLQLGSYGAAWWVLVTSAAQWCGAILVAWTAGRIEGRREGREHDLRQLGEVASLLDRLEALRASAEAVCPCPRCRAARGERVDLKPGAN